MKILYHINSLETVYAARYIYEGYKDAFIELGHSFKPYTASDNLEKMLSEFQPNIFISSLNSYNLKFLDLKLLLKYRNKGLVFFNQIRPWKKQNDQYAGSNLKNDAYLVDLIKKGLAGDIFFHWIEQDDPCMSGFTKNTGYPFYTILLAANTKKYFYDPDTKFNADISFVGNFLPSKRDYFKKHVLPLVKKYDVKIYGNDWTFTNRILGYIQKAGQYLNIPPLKKVRKMQISMAEERKVYSTSTISLNIHEEHQRLYGSDFNERTFKIIASGGFEICDNVKVLRKYFNENELVLAKNSKDWFEKIDYYLRYPEKRNSIIKLGRKKILSKHTYKNRAEQFIKIYKENKGSK